MSLPTSEPLSPDGDHNLSRARRRRQRRKILPGGSSERAEFIDELTHQATPSFDFFLFSLLAGLIISAAIVIDVPAVYMLAAIVSPFMAPVVGLSLGTILGALRFFAQSLGGLLMGCLLVFLGGASGGWAWRSFGDVSRSFQLVELHTEFSWPAFIVLMLGGAFTAYLLARNAYLKPKLASAALAYNLYIPLGAAGFGLTSGAAGLFPNGLVVFTVYLVWAALAGVIVLAFVGLRPLTVFSYVLAGGLLVFALTNAFALKGIQAVSQTRQPTPTLTAPAVSTVPATPVSASPVLADTSTLMPTHTTTPEPTRTATPTVTVTIIPSHTLSPTPAYAVISADEGHGAIIREEPDLDSDVLATPLNGTLVEILEVTQQGNVTWAHVHAVVNGEDIDGWIMKALVDIATLAP